MAAGSPDVAAALKAACVMARSQQTNAETLLQKNAFASIATVASESRDAEAKTAALELAMALLEASGRPKTKEAAGKRLGEHAYLLAASELEQIGTRSAAAELLNHLLAGCKPNCVLLSQVATLSDLVGVLERCSDYMLQSVMFEITYRFAKQTAATAEQLATVLAPHNAQCLAIMTSPLDGADFAATTRAFLSAFNGSLADKQRIFSMQCRDNDQWVDFGVVEMSLDGSVIQYRDITHVRVADLSVMLVRANDQPPITLLLSDSDCDTVKTVISDQIRAVRLNAERATKSSVLTMQVPSYAPPVPLLEEVCSSPHQQTSTAAPTPHTAPPQQTFDMAAAGLATYVGGTTPLHGSFVAPAAAFRRNGGVAGSQMMHPSPSLGMMPPHSPLVATIMQFGAALEDQMAQEKENARRQSEQFVAHVRTSLEKLCAQQQRQAAEARKRAEMPDDLSDQLRNAKRACSEAMAQAGAALAAVTALDERMAQLLAGRQEEMALADRHQRERDDFFGQFRQEE